MGAIHGQITKLADGIGGADVDGKALVAFGLDANCFAEAHGLLGKLHHQGSELEEVSGAYHHRGMCEGPQSLILAAMVVRGTVGKAGAPLGGEVGREQRAIWPPEVKG
jgi:hypothetical protein